MLGPTPSPDTDVETGLLNHPHISEQDGGPGTISTPAAAAALGHAPLLLPIAAARRSCSREHGYGSRPRFSSELLEDCNNIYSAFCKHPLGEQSALRRRHHRLATVTLLQQLLGLPLILASCSLFLNFPSCDSLRKPCAAKTSRQLVSFIIHVLCVIFFLLSHSLNPLIFMHDIYFLFYLILLYLQV